VKIGKRGKERKKEWLSVNANYFSNSKSEGICSLSNGAEKKRSACHSLPPFPKRSSAILVLARILPGEFSALITLLTDSKGNPKFAVSKVSHLTPWPLMFAFGTKECAGLSPIFLWMSQL
jgi:hypothetical protein